jgi:polysaccharide export outer membrane protein
VSIFTDLYGKDSVFSLKSITFATKLRKIGYYYMNKLFKKSLAWGLVCLTTILLSVSCKTPRNISYFQDVHNGQTDQILYSHGIQLKPGDAISIVVKSKSVELTNALNLPVTAQVIGTPEEVSLRQSQGISNYTIDDNGDIDFPVVGKIHIAGMSKLEVASTIKQILNDKQIASDAVVSVDYINLNYAVMGEVKSPGQFTFSKEKVSLLEALSTAGDLTIYGKRDSIIIWREEDGMRKTYVANILNGKELVNSPAYYLQQGDIVYVQPNNYRKRQSTANGNQMSTPSFWLSAISALATIGVLIFK